MPIRRQLALGVAKLDSRVRGLFSERRRIVFTRKSDWELILRQSIDRRRYAVDFVDLTPDTSVRGAVLIPLTLEGALASASMRASLPPLSVTPPAEVIQLCNDKVAFNDRLRRDGFASLLPRDVGPPQSEAVPVIIKPRRGEYGQGVVVVRDGHDMHREETRASQAGDAFAQEYIPGRSEYTTHFLMRGGRIVFSKTLEFTFAEDFYVKGIQAQFLSQKSVADLHLHQLTSVLKKLNYEGVGCFNYKVRDGAPVIFELNPRFGASLCEYITEFLDACFAAP